MSALFMKQQQLNGKTLFFFISDAATGNVNLPASFVNLWLPYYTLIKNVCLSHCNLWNFEKYHFVKIERAHTSSISDPKRGERSSSTHKYQ